VEILLEREKGNPDEQSYLGLTPLSYAAQSGYEQVVKILLRQEAVIADYQKKVPAKHRSCMPPGLDTRE